MGNIFKSEVSTVDKTEYRMKLDEIMDWWKRRTMKAL